MVVVAARDDDGARETTPSGLACLTLGSDPAVVVLVGLTSEHRVPTGMERRSDLRMVAPSAERLVVWSGACRLGGHMAAIAHRPAGRAVTHFLAGGPRKQR